MNRGFATLSLVVLLFFLSAVSLRILHENRTISFFTALERKGRKLESKEFVTAYETIVRTREFLENELHCSDVFENQCTNRISLSEEKSVLKIPVTAAVIETPTSFQSLIIGDCDFAKISAQSSSTLLCLGEVTISELSVKELSIVSIRGAITIQSCSENPALYLSSKKKISVNCAYQVKERPEELYQKGFIIGLHS